VIDVSTSSRAVGERVVAAARVRRVQVLGAPVAGQSIGALAGTLAVYVGGEQAAFDARGRCSRRRATRRASFTWDRTAPATRSRWCST
jgi:3-hydroxyisobutyrate dehydrogenase-like beta-hydroxyacid dehydrogenase